MDFWLWGALSAALGGVAVGFCCYRLSRMALLQKPRLYSVFSLTRQVLQVGYLAALYFLRPRLPWGLTPLLLGGALGLSAALLCSTRLLLRLSRDLTKKEGV